MIAANRRELRVFECGAGHLTVIPLPARTEAVSQSCEGSDRRAFPRPRVRYDDARRPGRQSGSTDPRRSERHQSGALARRLTRGQGGPLLSVNNAARALGVPPAA